MIPEDLDKDPHKNRIVVGTITYIFDELGRVLLFRRRKPPFAGYWEAPGGKVDFGERLKASALREVKEETGIIAREEDLIFVDLVEHIIMPKYHRIMVAYALEVPKNIKINLSEHDECRWFNIDKIPQNFLEGPVQKAYELLFGESDA